MKDRSRLLSSVIVSLLAGFIYYQFGDDIQSKLSSSFKAVISYNDAGEVYGPEYCQSFNSIVKKSDVKLNKKSKFYVKKRKTIEFKKDDVTISGDDMLSGIVALTQANFRKPTPDKNIDFSAELDNLVKSSTTTKDDKDLKFDWKQNKEGVVADNNQIRSNIFMIIKGLGNYDKEAEFDLNTGYGFEYNYTIDTENGGSSIDNNKVRIKTGRINKGCNSDCNSTSKCNSTEVRSETMTEEVKVVIPNVKFKVNDENVEVELPEIDIQDECTDEDPM